MKEKYFSTDAALEEAKEQQLGGVVEPTNFISTDQDTDDQACAGASPAQSKENAKNRESFQVLAKLNAGEEVQLHDFLRAGFRFADMPAYLQRAETKKDVAELQRSLIECKKFYRPIEIVPVNEFIEAGLGTPTRLGDEHTPISLEDKDIDFLFVRPDGKQRSCAAAKLFSKKEFKGKENEFDIRVKMCPLPINELPAYVREIQTSAVWDEKTKRQTTVARFSETESGLTVMNSFIEETGMSARAAYKLIFFKDGYKKALYEKSMADGNLHKDLQATPQQLDRAKHIFEDMKVAFRSRPKYFKNSAAVDAMLDIYARATKDQNDVLEQFLSFLMTLTTEQFQALDEKASVAEKKSMLVSSFDQFVSELETSPTRKDEVNQQVMEAKAEYKKIAAEGKKPVKKLKESNEKAYYEAGAHIG